MNILAVSSGSPKLWYNLTAIFDPKLEQFSYTIHGYLNDKKFLSCDVKSQNVDLKSLEKVAIAYLIEKEKELEEILWIIDKKKSEKKERSHTLQVILGCEFQMDSYAKGFWNCRYNGQDFLSLSLENLTWTGASPEAQEVKKILEKNKSRLNVQAYVLGHCPAYLRNYKRQNTEETASFISEMALPMLYLPDSITSGSMPTGTSNRAFTGIVTIISIIILAIIRM
ncbi:hereditary hemochromatosis protein homolog [Petaurus breviceps papuanus]|uniref:hereditary hemochromatosis protein homolog n=1 Tax=Petaurus breviceps papuanus TaxID=3040969 RepID=UPI0036D9C60A